MANISNNNVNAQFARIKDNVRHGLDKMILDLSNEAMENLNNAHKEIVDDFYKEKPHSYKRHDNDLHNTRIPQEPYKIGGRGNSGYKSGVVATAYNLSDTYRISPHNVFNLMWNVGVRGLPKEGTTPLSHSYHWLGHFYKKGEKWTNPYFQMFSVSLQEYDTENGTPHEVMSQVVKNWGRKKGIDWLNSNAKSYFGGNN